MERDDGRVPGVVDWVGGYGTLRFCWHEKNGYSDVPVCIVPIHDSYVFTTLVYAVALKRPCGPLFPFLTLPGEDKKKII